MSARRILIVEDDEGMREAIESLLDAAGFTTECYRSAEALLAHARLERALCVVTDLKLPAMSGLDLVSALRARDGCPPVILITAHDGQGVRDDARGRGAAGFLPKPFTGAALLAAIRAAEAPARPM